jgi:hypothetical protein
MLRSLSLVFARLRELSGFRRWCVFEACIAGIASLGWLANRDLTFALAQVGAGLLFLPGFLWDSRQSRPLRYTYNVMILICVLVAVFLLGRSLGRELGWVL